MAVQTRRTSQLRRSRPLPSQLTRPEELSARSPRRPLSTKPIRDSPNSAGNLEKPHLIRIAALRTHSV
ncbi:hypothetical protein PtA15_1A820 [Puccinia triticina]|uniref:Uncharacterized protein n=1 Tax=Puccinia triticina TaxID=208348 RepID=A0ABY7CAR2_9BASI|nr:uncharacterized protein PtA15_1A820 [Puccinia triticina]WAQ81478.1 hypothetical protein PtA15_1A820 [Puccinia triticina]WAR52360.1 hypothetical protein PtB15_1B801 [Puccinia triticina]